MKITIFTVFALFVFTLSSYAQNTFSIKGTTIDTITKAKLATTITVLNAKDSLLKGYTHTKPDGSFSIPDLPAGRYILWITYPAYAAYEERFTITPESPVHDFGNINMQLRSKVLNDVVIKGEVQAIKIRGDTTVYNARAFVIQPNDKVEDLLKQLPNVKIDKDGKITAQGETVPKVLVDGEEFFGDDPLLVTRNLRADMVDKVEIYNKKSDQATFTGIDDGKTTKTINIKLREDKKSGLFGKVVGGVSNTGLYDAQAMFNKFKGKYKLSAYGTTSTTGKNGLNGDDASRLGATSSSMVVFDDGGTAFISGGDDYDNASYSGSGIPKSATAGVHYDTKWNEDKESINSNYRISSLSLNTTRNVEQQQNYTDYRSNRSSLTDTYNSTFRQKADMIYQNNFNTNTSLKLSVDGTVKSTDNSLNTRSTNISEDGTLINSENRSEKTSGDQKLFNASLLFNKKFKKERRTISWNMSEAFSQTDSKRFINGVILTPAASVTSTTVKQYQPSHSLSSVLNSNITYTEPLSKKLSVIFNYGLGINNATSDREAYKQSSPVDPGFSLDPNRYDVVDADFTNNYKFNQLTNQVGALFNYRGTKTTLTFGTKATDVNFNQIDQVTSNVYKRSYLNWSPQTTFRYNFGPSTAYSFNYSGSASQPSISQIQPIRTNTDLLNITIGNPDLRPSFSHRFGTSYSASKSISGQYLSFSGNYSFSTNPMITRTVRDPLTGGITNQTVNLFDKTPYSYGFTADISRRILNGMTAEIYLTTNYNLGYSYNNGVLSTDGRRSFNATLYLQKNEIKKYGVSVSGGPNYSIYTYSARSDNNSRPFGYSISASGNLYLPGKFQIASDISYRYTGAVPSIAAYDYKMLNASIIKTFLKGDNLKFIVTGNNLFNQDVINRGSGPTGISQTTTNNILRYFMLTVSWDFTKFGTTSTPAQN